MSKRTIPLHKYVRMEDGSTVVEIPLTQGRVALVDVCDAGLASHVWYACFHKRKATIYAARNVMRDGRRTREKLHRAVLGLSDPRIQIDHINGDGLNNRRCNLRIASHSENQRNKARRANSSGFKGVSWDKHRQCWQARIALDWQQIHLGRFDDAESAARAYDAAARKLHGQFAVVNFPQAGERAA